jgi:tetratricopeptide (TPR) repeat protein
LNYEAKPPRSFGDGPRSSSSSASKKRKLIIIAVFCTGFIVLVVIFAPLMISMAALTMGTIDATAQDTIAAKEHLNLAIQTDPHSSLAYQYRGLLYGQLQEPDEAIADLTEAIKLGAGSDAYWGRAFQYHVLGKLDPALKDYQLALEKGAKKSDIWINQADVLYRLNKIDEAVSLCDKAIEESPRLQMAFLNRAQSNIKLGRYQAAVDDLDTAIDRTIPSTGTSTNDTRRDCLWTRAIAYQGLENQSDSEADMAEARKVARLRHQLSYMNVVAEAEFAQKTERKYFTLCSWKGSKTENEDQADRLQALLKFVNTNVAHVKATKRLHIFSFPDSKQYDTFMSSKNGLKEGAYDVDKNLAAMKVHQAHYDLSTNSIPTYASPNSNGLLYTLLEKVLLDTPFTDKWAPHGIAMLLTKSFGYNSSTDCQLLLSENLRTYALPAGKMPPLIEVVNNLRTRTDDEASMFAALFLFKKGKLQTYLELCHSGNIGKYSTLFEAAMAKDALALEPDWKSFVADVKKAQSPGSSLPKPQIFASREKFDDFSKKNPLLQLAAIKGNPGKGAKADDSEKPIDNEKPGGTEKSGDSEKPGA